MTGNDPAMLASARASSTVGAVRAPHSAASAYATGGTLPPTSRTGEVRCEREDRKDIGNVLDLIRPNWTYVIRHQLQITRLVVPGSTRARVPTKGFVTERAKRAESFVD